MIIINNLNNNEIFEKKYDRFIELWNNMSQNALLEPDEEYCIITTRIGISLWDVMTELREGDADFIFIHGVDKYQHEAYGLLCTNGVRQIADLDSMFFIGTLNNRYEGEVSTISLENLEIYLADDAQYRVGTISIVKQEQATELRIKSFLEAMDKKYKKTDICS